MIREDNRAREPGTNERSIGLRQLEHVIVRFTSKSVQFSGEGWDSDIRISIRLVHNKLNHNVKLHAPALPRDSKP